MTEKTQKDKPKQDDSNVVDLKSGGGQNPSKTDENGQNPSDKAENPKAVAGDNALTEDQQAALFHNHLKIYQTELAAKKAQDAKFRNACKMIKSEGSDIDDIKFAVALAEKDGEKDAKAGIENQIKIAKWMGYAIGYQIDLFPDRRPAAEKAKDDGKVAGLAGLPHKPPFDPGPLSDSWSAGWQAGQAALVQKLAPKAPEKDAKPPAAASAPKAPAPPAAAAKH